MLKCVNLKERRPVLFEMLGLTVTPGNCRRTMSLLTVILLGILLSSGVQSDGPTGKVTT